MAYTKEDVAEAYEKLIWAQGLIWFVLREGFTLSSGLAETEGSLISIFSILDDYLKKAAEVLEELEHGNEEEFIQLWKKEDLEEGAEQ
jgi:hypothetical protein